MLKLKVYRGDVPRNIPFSVVYIYLQDDCAAIRAAFPALFELRPYQLRHAAWAKVRVHTQQPRVNRLTYSMKVDHDLLPDLVPDLLARDSPWYLAIPTLLKSPWPPGNQIYDTQGSTDHTDIPSSHRDKGAGVPSYFGHGCAGNWLGRRNAPPIPRPSVVLDPILAVQGEEDRGVCSTCPRYAYNACGKCFFGDPVCHEHVRTLGAPTFLSHLANFLEK